jgi:hypothetical protein
MASYETTTTFDTTGTAAKTITPGFPVTSIRVEVTPANGLAFQGVQFCSGWTDGTRKKCDSVYANLSNGLAKSEKTTAKLIRLFGEDGSGNVVVVLEGTLNSITATQVKFDVTTANSNVQASILCEG